MPDEWEYPWYASLGSRLSRHPVRADRSGFRQTPTGRAHARALHAPQRSAAGLRVGVRRRQPAGPRLGGVPHLQDRSEAARRRRRSAVSRTRFSEAAAQFHLVGEPQGRQRAQRLSRRLPRSRQHRGLRPQHEAADRRLPRASRRHGVDGACTRSTCWRSRSSWRATTRSTSTWPTSSSSTSFISPTR